MKILLSQIVLVQLLIIGLLGPLKSHAKAERLCDSTELAQVIQDFETNKSPGIGRLISQCYLANMEYEKASKWLKMTIEYSSEKLASDYFDLARMYFLTNKKLEARETAMDVLAMDESYQSKVFTLIGDMYLSSYEECFHKDIIKSRSVFIAAYEMYVKANNKSRMKLAEEQFPSGEDVHHILEGELIQVDCLIGEEVELRFRKEE